MDAMYVGLSLPALLKAVSGELMDFAKGKETRELRGDEWPSHHRDESIATAKLSQKNLAQNMLFI